MNFIVDISKFIIIPLFCEWLCFGDLGRTDSANCNKSTRIFFINLINHKSLQINNVTLSVSLQSSVTWLSARHLKVFELNFTQELWRTFDCKYSQFCLENLKSLNVIEESTYHEYLFMDVIAMCRSLTSVDLGKCEFVNDKIVFAIAKTCVQLTTFLCICENVNYTLHDKSIDYLTNKCFLLEVLHLGNCLKLTDSIGKYISENCNLLRNLSICDLANLTDKSLILLCKLGCKCLALTNLYVCNCKFTSCNIAWLCFHLKCLVDVTVIMSLENVSHRSDYFSLPVKSKCLTSAKFIGMQCGNFFIKGMTLLSKDLRELTLVGDLNSNACGSDGYIYIAQNCSNLEKLTLGKCANLVEDNLIPILEACGGKLTYLSIIPLFLFSSTLSDAIVNNCSELKHLKLSNICLMTISCLTNIVERLEKLVSLDLSSDCSFPISFNWSLWTVGLKNANNILIVYLCECFANMNELIVLKQCHRITVKFLCCSSKLYLK